MKDATDVGVQNNLSSNDSLWHLIIYSFQQEIVPFSAYYMECLADLATLSSKLPLLKPMPEDNFVLGTIIGQPPQTRRYHFTVSEVQGAPDGVSKPMLVVNGTILLAS
jgi:hypothetical protein